MSRDPRYPNALPRRMNGMAALVGQARDLRGKLGPQAVQGGQAQTLALLAEADKLVRDLSEALATTRLKLRALDTYLTSFSVQVRGLPEEHPARITAERMIEELRKALDMPERTGDGEPGCRDCADNDGTCPHDGHKCGE